MLATHADRKGLFLEAGRTIVDLAHRWYQQDDASVLPRGIASFAAFENAMTVDIAMGGSTNTVLHLLAAAHEAGVDFTMRDIDRLSRRVPVLCKVAPVGGRVHLEDVHRAGGVLPSSANSPGRASLHRARPPCTPSLLGEALERWDVRRTAKRRLARVLYRPRPAACRPGRLQPGARAASRSTSIARRA